MVGAIATQHLPEDRCPVRLCRREKSSWGGRSRRGASVISASPADITDIRALPEVVGGVLTGARANVRPAGFGNEPHPAHDPS